MQPETMKRSLRQAAVDSAGGRARRRSEQEQARMAGQYRRERRACEKQMAKRNVGDGQQGDGPGRASGGGWLGGRWTGDGTE